MTSPLKERIQSDIANVKETGTARAEKLKDILRVAVSQALAELKAGSAEIRPVVKDAIAAVIESVKTRGADTQSDITASIEGVVEGVNTTRREAITQIETEMDRLQQAIDTEEDQLREEVNIILADIEETSDQTSSDLKDTIRSVVNTIRNSPEAALMRKRYAQLRTQIAILRANLKAEDGNEYDRIQQYLAEAKAWYNRTKEQANVRGQNYTEQKQAEFEARMSEAGAAAARRESQVRRYLQNLWHLVVELFQEKRSPS